MAKQNWMKAAAGVAAIAIPLGAAAGGATYTIQRSRAAFQKQALALADQWNVDEKAGVPGSDIQHLQKQLALIEAQRVVGIPVTWLSSLGGTQQQLSMLGSEGEQSLEAVTQQARATAQIALSDLEKTMGSFAAAGHRERLQELNSASTPAQYLKLSATWKQARTEWEKTVTKLKAESGGLDDGMPSDVEKLNVQLVANVKQLPQNDVPSTVETVEASFAKYIQETPSDQLNHHADMKASLNQALTAVAGARAEIDIVKPGSNPFGQAFQSYLHGRESQVSVAIYNANNGQTYSYQPDITYDTASIVKASIMADLLHQSQVTGQPLTSQEQKLMVPMIEESDNNAASGLWGDIGEGTGIESFLQAAGMTHTTPGSSGYWGLTSTTALDQLNLMKLYAYPNNVLNQASQQYGLNLMENVVDWEDWGVSTGPEGNAVVALKNGWSPATPDDWRINSIGYVDGDGRNYVIAVLSQDNPTEQYGIATVDEVSDMVWEALG